MQRFTAQWVEVKILDVNAFPYQGENEKDDLWVCLCRKEILQLMCVLRSEKSFQHKALQRQFPNKEKGTLKDSLCCVIYYVRGICMAKRECRFYSE